MAAQVGGLVRPTLRCAKDGAPALVEDGDEVQVLRLLSAALRFAQDDKIAGLVRGF